MMDDWDKLDQQYSGGAAPQAGADPWAELDASFQKPAKAAAPAKVSAIKDLPKVGAAKPLTRMDRVLQGMRDPLDGAAQLLYNALPTKFVKSMDAANNWVADKTGILQKVPEGGIDQQIRERETAYQAARRASMPRTVASLISGQSEDPGLDGYRLVGNVASPMNLAIASRLPAAASLAGRVGVGAGFGAVSGATTPVFSDGPFMDEKLKQIGMGAAFGGVVPVATGAVGRIISPNASKNANLQLLKKEGVNPTVGQALGGRWNTAEEKLTSLPIMGDAISMARARSMDQFNKAAINRATAPIGEKVDDIGQSGVMQAGDKLSTAYDDALAGLGPVRFDNQFSQQAGQLQQMAGSLVPDMQTKFMKAYQDLVVGRMSPNGTMLPETFKKVDSELGRIASKYGKSSVASEQEAGDAIKQLQTILKEQAARSDPTFAGKLSKADEGWANLVRVEGAAKAAKNNQGVFTPAQLNAAIQSADDSVRGRAVARGSALMQDLGNAGQQVIGNKVPNSFTADRAMLGLGGLSSGLWNPAIPASLFGGAAMYTSPMQRLLVGAASARPQSAEAIAKALKKGSPYAIPAGAQLGPGLLNQ